MYLFSLVWKCNKFCEHRNYFRNKKKYKALVGVDFVELQKYLWGMHFLLFLTNNQNQEMDLEEMACIFFPEMNG